MTSAVFCYWIRSWQGPRTKRRGPGPGAGLLLRPGPKTETRTLASPGHRKLAAVYCQYVTFWPRSGVPALASTIITAFIYLPARLFLVAAGTDWFSPSIVF